MPSLKIAYLISCYPAFSHTFIKREIELLRKEGFEIAVASINESDIPLRKQTPSDQKEIHEIFYIKRSGFFAILRALFTACFKHPMQFFKAIGKALTSGPYTFFYLIEAALVGQWMAKKGFNHLHVHFANPASHVALFVSHLYPFTYSITVHGPDDFFDVTQNKLKEKIEGAKFIVCISFFTKSQLIRLVDWDQWSKFYVIYLGVDPHIFVPKQKVEQEKVEIVSIGRLTPTKGQFILLQALEKLQKDTADFHLTLIGEGPDRKILQKAIAEKGLLVDLKGAMNQEETRQLLEKGDIFVLSSFAEGLPVSLMEAMSMEIPCIAPGISGIPELITHEWNGLLVFPSDMEGLTQALKRLCKDRAFRLKLGKKSRQTILEKYNLVTNVHKLGQLFRKNVD